MLPRLLLAAAFLGCTPAAAAALPRLPANCHRDDFRSGSKSVDAALCMPQGRTRSPAVVVLHGCGGFDTFDHRLAVELPASGIATMYLDYFAPTPPPSGRGFCDAGLAMVSAFHVWEQEVIDAVKTLVHTTGIDPKHIGLVGWSLGGGLGVATLASTALRLQALVGFSTGSFDSLAVQAHFPPTLLLSAGAHDAIPLADTEALYRSLRAAGVPVSLYVYRNGVHQWPGRQGTAGIAVARRFLSRILG